MASADNGAPKEPVENEKQGSCAHCNRPDSYDNYVQCDRCHAWWHYLCAGVNDSVADRSFTCEACSPVSVSSRASSSSSRVAAMQIRLREMEEQFKKARQELENERQAFEKERKLLQQEKVNDRRDDQRTAEWVEAHGGYGTSAKGQIADREAAAATDPHRQGNVQDVTSLNPAAISSAMQAAINAAVQAAVQAAFQTANPTRIHQQPSNSEAPPRYTGAVPKSKPKDLSSTRIGNDEVGSLQKGKQDTPLPPEKPSGKSLKNQTLTSNYDQWIQEITKRFGNTNLGHPTAPEMPSVGTVPLQPGQPAKSIQISTSEWNKVTNDVPKLDATLGTCPNFNNLNLPTQANIYPVSVNALGSLGTPSYIPTPSQLAARQVMPRDLPSFNGDPADWPMFISSFVNTTLACGYTSAENLARLQRSLKGDAYEAVRSRLLLPDTVPQVLNTLQLLYGRPELLINALLQKVRSVPAPKAEKLETLIEFGMAVQSLCDHLEAAGQHTHLSNPTLLMELVEKLPAHTKMEWASFLQRCPEVNLQSFGVFMSSIVISATKVTGYAAGLKPSTSDKYKGKPKGFINAHDGNGEEKVQEDRVCCVCDESGHRVTECELFRSFSVDGRWKCVQSNGLCRNCLNAHGRRSCRYSRCCGVGGCEFRHHPLLHSDRSTRTSYDGTPKGTASNNTHRPAKQSTLFRIVPVTLYGPKTSVKTYAFLDDGSSFTLVEEELINELGIRGSSMPLCLTWTANMTRSESNSEVVHLSITGTGDKKRMEMIAHTVQNLGLASQNLNYGDLVKRFQHLKGLPITSYKNAVPRLLVGVDNLNLTVPLNMKEGGRYEPVAVKTRLGWCIYGGEDHSSSSNVVNVHTCSCVGDRELHNLVKEYFTVEDVGAKSEVALESTDDQRARMILQETTKRVDGRYQTGLLWKYDRIEFPDSFNMALKRLECLERRMNRDPKLKENIHRQLVEYQAKGYARAATQAELDRADPRRVWYLPLGAVVNPKKPGKVRLIWDAAASVEGISLNSLLLKGPDQLASLSAVLSRFRQFSIGVSADIKEMFHQIEICETDRHSQRFLWRTDPSRPPTIFLMNVATFGSSSSPASAQFVKNKNAEEFADRYPKAVQAIVDNHYVDDYLDSFENEEEALRVSQEVRMIHSRGGFQLRNWLTNGKQVLEGLGESSTDETKNLFLDKGSECERVLGMLWNTRDDVLCYSTELKEDIQQLMDSNVQPTKRQMLRCLMSFFDPLGLLSAVLVHGRILLQDVWRVGTQWDEPVGDDIWNRWMKWINAVKTIDQIRIPRCYFRQATMSSYEELQLHIFVDASELAYSAVAYFRIVTASTMPDCALVAAKAKVAPLKPLSVPRLELQAAVLGARLMRFVIDTHTITTTKRFLWSDSSTVLAWIHADHRRYKQFVACRIGEILTLTDADEWRWVPTKINPADAATKWGKGPCMQAESEWFKGPEFLRRPEKEWPSSKFISTTTATEEELRPCHVHREVVVPGLEIDYQRFSKWERVLRTVAYALRFTNNLKLKCSGVPIRQGILTKEELQEAQITLFRSVQWQVFPDEMAALAADRRSPIKPSSDLHSLCPYLDQQGLLRVDSRIKTANKVALSMKFPIILPPKHRLTLLLIDEYHRKYRHANFETVVNEVRQRFHVSRLRPTVKKVTQNCLRCRIDKAKPCIPRMAPLPPARLAAYVRPFSYVGLDFFGPFLVKFGRSNVKRWIALFTCLTIRAVHVEVVCSLTTNSCIECVRRFICRRGDPLEIYSDNGTNFRGAARLLNEQKKEISIINENLAGAFTSTTTKWLFIPPAAPHMGGAWERMVRSVKTAMFAAYDGNRKLTDEGLQTLVIEAESIVNSRPLTYLPLESAESEALTPNHFLLPLKNIECKDFAADTTSEKHKQTAAAVEATWNATQQHLNTYWKRWIREYLPTLTKRTKWFGEQKAIEVGDLVLVIDGTTRNEWIRGRVKEVVAGSDQRIRQAIVQTARGLMRRPVSKLAVLEVRESG
ncbi:uncharacterized protein LOC134288304 [Aedes albopictus]|uniref:Uncharacterized protein n=1 Tax=Aedes albopictus TaxID=7160 RepID=A0ABM1XMN8_AEDAL